jgi:hypothetical protein
VALGADKITFYFFISSANTMCTSALNVAAAVCCSVVALAAAVVAVVTQDGRSIRLPPSKWNRVKENPRLWEGWMKQHLRCTYESYAAIVRMVEQYWHDVNPELGENAHFLIPDRVAVTLHYLTHSGSFADSAIVFGMGSPVPTVHSPLEWSILFAGPSQAARQVPPAPSEDDHASV